MNDHLPTVSAPSMLEEKKPLVGLCPVHGMLDRIGNLVEPDPRRLALDALYEGHSRRSRSLSSRAAFDRRTISVISAGAPSRIGGPQKPVPRLT